MARLLSPLYYNIGIFVVLRNFNLLFLTSIFLTPKSRDLNVDLSRSATLTFWVLPR